MLDENKSLPQAAQDALNEIAREKPRAAGAKKVFIAIPNMNQICVGLVAKLFHFAMQRKYDPWFHFVTEKRHTDFARNKIVEAFLEGKCDYLMMIDADVDPHKDILSLIDHDKQIMSGNVFCWINGELMPSIWQRAECEQCRNLKIYMQEGKVHDATQYREKDGILERWNPFRQMYVPFANREGMLPELKCRCRGTGIDPFVFRTFQKLGKDMQKVDSVGSASLFVRRDVFDKIPFPWFRFLYRESGEILVTEDHYFCWKAMECDIDIWAHPQMWCSHYKTVDLLQLTATINKAYEAGKKSQKVTQSIIIPE
jgi:hypothetical protein